MKLTELTESRYTEYPKEIKLLDKWLNSKRKHRLNFTLDPKIDPEKIIKFISEIVGNKPDVDMRGRSADLDADGIVAWILGRWTIEFDWIYDEENLLFTGQTNLLGYVE